MTKIEDEIDEICPIVDRKVGQWEREEIAELHGLQSPLSLFSFSFNLLKYLTCCCLLDYKYITSRRPGSEQNEGEMTTARHITVKVQDAKD